MAKFGSNRTENECTGLDADSTPLRFPVQDHLNRDGSRCNTPCVGRDLMQSEELPASNPSRSEVGKHSFDRSRWKIFASHRSRNVIEFLRAARNFAGQAGSDRSFVGLCRSLDLMAGSRFRGRIVIPVHPLSWELIVAVDSDCRQSLAVRNQHNSRLPLPDLRRR